ncbi:flagellar basal-body protein FlbY [Maricaulis sp.]|uniref:flagellar basal-body protein FlbY n=1 Tax=Maricaulis sp. TaxID=1486257 RepID=UPI002614EE06|nr:flagellar basal-body protein FlbY [Maricaulis sp.]
MTELAARNGAERAQALLKLTQRLTDLIRQETSLFKERRPQDALPLQDEKSKLANIYRTEVSRARQEPTRFAGAPSTVKSALRQSTEVFHKALAENGHAVAAMKQLTEGVVKAIADEAARQKSAGGGYGPGATHQTHAPSGMNLAINQTI